jgi:hypothetical protein
MFKKYILFIIIASLSVISCGNNETTQKETDLCKDTVCGSGYSCNEDNGICEKIENYCLNDTMCKEGEEVCDKVHHQCKLIPSKDYCESHNDCEYWEICNFDNAQCKPRDGMCDMDDDCITPPFLQCNTRIHKCTDPGSCLYNFCEEWEICKEDEECYLRDGYCLNNDDCLNQFPYDSCNLETHSCIRPITPCQNYTDCNQNYQYCDTAENLCKASLGKCRSNLDCIENTENGNKLVCDKNTYNCITTPENNCKITGCNYWQNCNESIGICELPENRCNNNNDCLGIREICNQAHYCEVDDCTTHGCDWWKLCIRDTGECKLYDGMCDSSNDCTSYDPYTNCTPLLHTYAFPINI